jgi:PilZ domain
LASWETEAVRTSVEERDQWRFQERRKEARYTLILRAGVLDQLGKSSLCLVKNISTAGVQVKVYSKPVTDAEVAVRIADERPVHGRITWVNDDIAGISFHEDLDAATLLRVQQKLRSKRRRAMPRVPVQAVATLRTGGHTYRAGVCDISSLGARFRTNARMRAGDRVMVELQDLPAIKGYVRWSDADESGVAFETAIPMQIIASWVEGRVSQGD